MREPPKIKLRGRNKALGSQSVMRQRPVALNNINMSQGIISRRSSVPHIEPTASVPTTMTITRMGETGQVNAVELARTETTIQVIDRTGNDTKSNMNRTQLEGEVSKLFRSN